MPPCSVLKDVIDDQFYAAQGLRGHAGVRVDGVTLLPVQSQLLRAYYIIVCIKRVFIFIFLSSTNLTRLRLIVVFESIVIM